MKALFFTFVFNTGVLLQFITARTPSEIPQGVFDQQKTRGISFTENKGQICDQNFHSREDVLYGVSAGQMTAHIKKNGISYQLYQKQKSKFKEPESTETRIYRIDLNWLNANTHFWQSTDDALFGYNNYYLENCPSGVLNVKSYTGITLHNLYHGIDLHYYEKNGELKHDYIVAPGAGYKQIQIEVKGAEVTINKDGSLMLNTPLGKVQEGVPLVFQHGKLLRSKWVVNKGVLSFEIENYNPALELIIDPVTRLWGTYYGGNGTDEGWYNSSDAAGNIYMAGHSDSNTGTFIATTGAHQSTFSGGMHDAFLVKFNNAGIRQWGTYYGGSNTDYGVSCSNDASGNVYLAGYTSSSSGTAIASGGAHQSVYGGGIYDVFLVKLNSSGIRQWSSYYGGSGGDFGGYCSTDASGNVYLAGYTNSANGTAIATAGAHQTSHSGGSNNDAFIVKFNTNGVRQWGTYYGGTGTDLGSACCTDASGNVYLTGRTLSTGTVMATAGAHQISHSGGSNNDAYLVKFNGNGIRQWGTYYGGTGIDVGNSCSTDATGNVYLCGNTDSNNGNAIATPGAHQSVYGGGLNDGYLVKFTGAGVRQWGTYYGGTGIDIGNSCSTDATGNVYLTGYSESFTGNEIATPGVHQPLYGGNTDGYSAKFSSSGVRQWGTYYGGNGLDIANGCCTDPFGNVYITGYTESATATVIASTGAHQGGYGGGIFDAFLVKLSDCALFAPTAVVNNNICSGASLNFTAAVTGTAAVTYSWSGPAGFSSGLQNPVIANAGVASVGIYTLYVNNNGCVATATAQVSNIYPSPTITVNSGTLCVGQSYTIIPGGASSYTIQGGNFVVSPVSNTSYTVTGTSSAGCLSAVAATCNITVSSIPTISVNSGTICSGSGFTIAPGGASTYTIEGGNAVVNPLVNTTYTVRGANTSGCISANTATCNVTVNQTPTVSVNSGTICSGNSFTILPSGAFSYTIQGGNAVVGPLSSTFYTVAGTSSAGCISANTATSNITVNPTPTISVNSGTICSGNSFTILPSGAFSYTIQGGFNIVNPSANTAYTVAGNSSAGCMSANTATCNITVNPSPVITAVSSESNVLCVGQSATLTASGADTYTWSTAASAAVIVISPTSTTTYTVIGTDINGCTNTTSITQNVSACTGIEATAANTKLFGVYPNPASDKLHVVLPVETSITSIVLVNSLGQTVYKNDAPEAFSVIDVNNLPNGIYFIKLLDGNKLKATGKIIKH